MLNEKQKKILSYLRERAQTGVPPTVREICAATGIRSTSTVHAYLKLLEEQGYISRQSGLNRAIRLPGDNVISVPLIGRVTAGQPILAVEEVEGYVSFSGSSHGSPEDLFALRAIGDSMINAGILNDDIIIVQKSSEVRNGDIVVALIEDEATVKRIYYENGYIRLQPENEKYEPIIVKEAIVLGKVIALLRYF